MGYSNGIISSPVSIADVKKALTSPTNDLGTLCSHIKVNMWAKYKPIKHSSKKELSDEDRNNANWGINFGVASYPTDSVDFFSWSVVKPLLVNWTWNKPTGGETSPYRLTDFVGYKHKAQVGLGVDLKKSSNTVDWSAKGENNWMAKIGCIYNEEGDAYVLGIKDLKFELGGHDADGTGLLDINKAHFCALVIKGNVDPLTKSVAELADNDIVAVFVNSKELQSGDDGCGTINISNNSFKASGLSTYSYIDPTQNEITILGCLGFGMEANSNPQFMNTYYDDGGTLRCDQSTIRPKYFLAIPYTDDYYPVLHINKLTDKYYQLEFELTVDDNGESTLFWRPKNGYTKWFTIKTNDTTHQGIGASKYWYDTESVIRVFDTSNSGDTYYFSLLITNPNTSAKSVRLSNISLTSTIANVNLERLVNDNFESVSEVTIQANSSARINLEVSGVYLPDYRSQSFALKYFGGPSASIEEIANFSITRGLTL